MSVLKFDVINHKYYVGGVEFPSVTRILKPLYDFSDVHPDVLRRAAQFGQHVHTATELYDQGNLDIDALDPGLVPYLNGWIKFLETCNPELTHIEQKVYSTRYRYAGTLDRAGIFRRKKCLFDIKTGIYSPATGPQTAAYVNAIKEMIGLKLSGRFTVLLRPDNFKLIEHTDKNDFNTFLSCQNIHNFLKTHKGE